MKNTEVWVAESSIKMMSDANLKRLAVDVKGEQGRRIEESRGVGKLYCAEFLTAVYFVSGAKKKSALCDAAREALDGEIDASGLEHTFPNRSMDIARVSSINVVDSEWKKSIPWGLDGETTIKEFLGR